MGNKRGKISDIAWVRRLISAFWRYPDRLLAIKATLAMAILSVPLILTGKPFFGLTLALGALAGALAETDDHPRGRIKALFLTVVSFAISTLSVQLLLPWPWIFGIGFVGSTIVFILLGGMGERYRGITFGAILIGIYAMLGAPISPAWYWQPILLPAGALFYGIISLILLYYKPWRLLEEQLARGFTELSHYLEEKAKLFPSDVSTQAEIRNRLALLNVSVVGALEKCKDVLNSYGQEVDRQEVLLPYLQRFMLLQGLHERAASSHEQYDLLSDSAPNREMLEGLGELLRQLSYAARRVAENMLTGIPYYHPVALNWIVSALRNKLDQNPEVYNPSLILLLHNLYRSHLSLQNLNNISESTSIPRLSKDERSLWERVKAQLTIKHPRMRYAIRLSSSFLAGYILFQWLDIEKGAWIMLTSLFVGQPTFSETRRRLFQRVLGTITGVIGGILIVQLLPTTGGQILLLLAAAYLFFFWKNRNYSVAVVFITIFVLCVFNLIANVGVAMMLPRLIDTLIGASLSILSVWLLWPGWQFKRLPGLLSEALKSNASYFHSILAAYAKEDEDDFEYRVARRNAHKADNELALSWQSMRLEPRRVQHFLDHAFTLTYLNHALLSYLSALGAHRDTHQLSLTPGNEIAGNIENALLEAGAFLAEKDSHSIDFDLQPVLLQLRKQINGSEDVGQRQQLRIIYNITDVSDKLLKELETISNVRAYSGKE